MKAENTRTLKRPMSGRATRDSGDMQQLAYAELLQS